MSLTEIIREIKPLSRLEKLQLIGEIAKNAARGE